MKFKTLLISLSLFSNIAYSQIQPTLSIYNDSICSLFRDKITTGDRLTSYQKSYGRNYSEWALFDSSQQQISPIKYSNPINNYDIDWLEWLPADGLKFKFDESGHIKAGISISSTKPAPDKSFIMQLSSQSLPHLALSIIDDSILDSVLNSKSMQEQSKNMRGKNVGNGYTSIEGAHLLFSSSSEYDFRNLFKFKGHFYKADENEVYKLQGNEFTTVCKVDRSLSKDPQVSAFEYTVNNIFAGGRYRDFSIADLVEPDSFYTGYRNGIIVNGLKDAIEAPWLIKVDDNGECIKGDYPGNCLANKAVDIVLNNFAAQDPWSYREVQAYREQAKIAKNVLSQLYIKQLGLTPSVAKGMANQVVYDLLFETGMYADVDKPMARLKDPYTLDDPQGSIANNFLNKTDLMWAAHFNDYDAIQRILEKVKTINLSPINYVTFTETRYSAVQRVNRSALTYAAENATLPVIQSLINAGAYIGIKDSKNNGLDYYLRKNNLVDYTIQEIAAMPSVDIKPSFNCKRASTTQEKAICADKGLAVYDSQMAKLYKKVREIPAYNIKAAQRSWLKDLRKTCTMKDKPSLYSCMKSEYRGHIKFLNNLLAVK